MLKKQLAPNFLVFYLCLHKKNALYIVHNERRKLLKKKRFCASKSK